MLANIALRDGADADVGQVVMDEFHFYADPDRGWAWQVPLLELPRAQFLLMSATLGDMRRFETDLTWRTGRPTAVVHSAERPVPLVFSFVLEPLHETLKELLSTNQAPIYVVHFTQAAALEQAQALMSVNVCSRAEKDAIADLIGNFRFSAGFGKTLSRLVRHGIGVHHAGMLPRYRRLVETLTQAGLLKVICGTDTLGVGINVPIRTVLFTALSKYDGTKTRLLQAREFHQIAGRRPGRLRHGGPGGRAGPRARGGEREGPGQGGRRPQGAAQGGPQEAARGLRVLGQADVRAARRGRPRAADLELQGHPRHGAERDRPAGRRVRGHAPPADRQPRDRPAQRRHIHQAIAIYRALLAGGVVERLDEPDEEGRMVRLTVDLQLDFALNQPLSPFALAAIELLDVESPSYALDVLSVIESTLENPRQVLSAQQFRARGEAVAQMKADGVGYEERLELLDDVTYPKPLEDLLDGAYEIYRRGHPWVADYEVRPKSVVRDMYERALTFAEYVAFYGLSRSEGLVLRYLADAYKALRQTVPDEAKTEDLTDLIEWLGEIVRQVDSSLLDEWERLRNPLDAAGPSRDERPATVTSNVRAFRVLVRNALFHRVRLAALGQYEELGALDSESGWDAAAWEEVLEGYFDVHDEIGTGSDARGPALLMIDQPAGPVDGPADLRRSGGRPRLGHQRGRRPGRVGRGRLGRAAHHRRRAAVRVLARGF